MRYVYVDLLLLINFFMNYIILYLTATLCQIYLVPWRLGAASLLGGIYALLVLLLSFPLLSLAPVKILVSLAMVVIAFGLADWLDLLHQLTCFYLLSFLTGGATLFILHIGQASSDSVPWWSLPAAVVASTGAGYLVWRQRNQYVEGQNVVKVKMRFDTTWVEVQALIDTGNRLCDPTSLLPIIIMELNALIPVLPAAVLAMYKRGEMDLGEIVHLEDPCWLRRCRIIPFTSLGRERGLLLGIRPDEVCFFLKDRWQQSKPTLVGVANQDFLGHYQALIPPSLF